MILSAATRNSITNIIRPLVGMKPLQTAIKASKKRTYYQDSLGHVSSKKPLGTFKTLRASSLPEAKAIALLA